MRNLTYEQIIRNVNLYLLSDTDIELEEPYLSIYNGIQNLFRNFNSLTDENIIYYYKKDSFVDESLVIYNKITNYLLLEDDIFIMFYEYSIYTKDIENLFMWYMKHFIFE